MESLAKLGFSCLIVAILVFQVSAEQKYRCSKNEEKCVFPFEDDGVMYNECKPGTWSPWCKTDGGYGWAYCDICPEDLITTTTTTSTTTIPSTTIPTTTTSTQNTINSVSTSTSLSTSPTTSTTPNSSTSSTTPKATTTLTTPTSTTPISATTSTTPKSTTTSTIPTNSSSTTTRRSTIKPPLMTVPLISKTTPWATTEAQTTPNEDDFSEFSTTDFMDLEDENEDPSMEEENKDPLSEIPDEDVSAGLRKNSYENAETETPTTTTVKTTTTTIPVTKKTCTRHGELCKFPFEYKGETYYTCVESYVKKYGWCYTDDDWNWSDCKPCDSTSSSTTTTTTKKTPESTSEPTSPKIILGGRLENPKSSSSTPKPSSSSSTKSTTSRKASPSPKSAKSLPTEKTTSKKMTTSPSPKSAKSSPTEKTTSEKTTTVAKNDVKDGKVKTTTTPKLDDDSDNGSDTSSGVEETGVDTITIIVVTLCLLAFIVVVVILFLYIRKQRNAKLSRNAEKNGTVGESGERLLVQTKNGKTANGGDSQEMKPLNSREDEVGDCDVINEKDTNGTANITV